MKYVFYRQLGRLFETVGINIGDNDDIAFLLGYEDTTSFLRAFSTWTGQTVTEYKKR